MNIIGEGNPIPVFLSEKSHSQRSLVDYYPKSHKELDMTERLSLNELYICMCVYIYIYIIKYDKMKKKE